MTYAQRSTKSLSALGDPTRRSIFELLARRPAAVGEIAKSFPVSRPAVSQHLRILKEANLVTETSEGTRRIYRIDPRGIAALRDWLDAMWSAALEDFAAFADGDTAPASPPATPERKEP